VEPAKVEEAHQPAPGEASAEPPTLRAALISLRQAEKEADGYLQSALGRGPANPEELLRLQIVVQRFQYQVELASRVVEQVSQGVRTLTRPTG
jgi:hypothetical protein